MFTDERRRIVFDQLRSQDSRGLARVLNADVVTQAARRSALVVANGPLNVVNLVWLGVIAALHLGKNFADVLGLTHKLLADHESLAPSAWAGRVPQEPRRWAAPRSRHDPRVSRATVSEEAYVKARQRLPTRFWLDLLLVLAERFETRHAKALRWRGFRLLALDGTCIDLPNWKALREAYGACRNARGPQRTQARLVMLQFPLVRLPYAYEVTPLSQGETTVALRLLSHVQRDDLVLIDRGFFSYGLLARLHRQGAFFGIRLKGGIKLKALKRLGPEDRLVEWRPQKVRQQDPTSPLPKALSLRLIRYQFRGFRGNAVLTNVTDPRRLSRADWVRLAEPGGVAESELYHRRWEIETTFYELKVTQGMEGGLRGRTRATIEYEIGAHVVIYLAVRWLMVEAAIEHGAEPLRLSFAQALREFDDLRVNLLQASAAWAQQVLIPRLLARIAAHRVPLRPGRHFPRPKDGQPKNRGHGQRQPAAKIC